MKRVFLPVWVAVALLFCLTPSVFAVDGWASMNGGTTGGADGNIVTISTASEFRSYVETIDTPYIVNVTGTINLYTEGVGGTVYIESNKTIRGIGTDPTIVGQLRFEDDASNVIIERLNITNPFEGGQYDGISVKDRITNVFITNCTVYDCGDGGIDITKESNYITVSWCKFYYNNPAPDEGHRFVNLVGGSDSDTGDRGKLKTTFHHNWWANRCRERMPRVRFGQVHVYNNYYNCTGNNNCIRPGKEAQLLIENNYFDHVDEPIEGDGDAGPDELVERHDNIFYHCTTMDTLHPGTDDVFDPNYSYTLDNAADVPSIVMDGAGVGEWLYGDFTGDDIVDMNDIPYFAEFWVENDCNETAGLDLNGDCIINFYEFSLLAWNWLKEIE